MVDTQPPLLAAEGLTVRFGGMRALDDVSFTLRRGERLGVIGPNGAGKSTLLKVIAGDLRAGDGRTVFDGRPVPAGGPWRRARLGVVRTRQELGLFPTMTVRENLQCGADHGDRRTRGAHRRGRAASSALEGLMEIVGIERWSDEIVGSLPYGVRKLTELVRALACRPNVLMLDEPVAGLNTAEKAIMVERLASVLTEVDVALVLVEHDMPSVAVLCPDRTLAMVAGRVAAEGTFDEVVRTESVVEAYFGVKPVSR